MHVLKYYDLFSKINNQDSEYTRDLYMPLDLTMGIPADIHTFEHGKVTYQLPRLILEI